MAERKRARELASNFIERGDPLGWFDPLYREARTNWALVPWADLAPNPHLLALDGSGKRALKIGCGLGDDAEQLAIWGFDVVAFDISPAAISLCRERFPFSRVEYSVANLLAPAPSWTAAFDFVLESYTLQVLPQKLRPKAIQRIASFVAPGGSLFVIARGREKSDPPGEMPWPLTQTEVALFEAAGLTRVSWEDFMDAETPPVRRFRARYRMLR
ncbi:MAG TPA: class I SAM-dependent methyltransferase [Bryobacteraceae bacterium]